ncbi:Uncharacterized protein AB751O23_AB_00230 [Chlamydiales bacterium SCGC AB-751-O23]|jgi:UDP-glucose:(heptosyl)LPS alpha-1,3-glucosyltransferase|nr:Uncharacterized protein AB751O23_AB_00230 [Chlamydiales bacterium SCGC AB-751-O23]
MPKKVYFLKRVLSSLGGLEKYTSHLADAFKKQGKEVHFICQQQTEDQSLPTLTLPTPLCLFNYQRIKSFDQGCHYLFRKEKKNALFFGTDRSSSQHIYRAGNGVHAYYLDKRMQESNKFKRFSLKYNPLHQTLLDIEKRAFESPSLQFLITNSQMVKKQILKHYNTEEERIKVIHNGVEWYKWQNPFNESFDICKSSLGFHPDLPLLLFVGNGWERKGLKELLEALAVVKSKGIGFQLAVLGKEKNIKYYKELTNNLKLSSNIKFVGPCKQVISYYQIADVAIIPSHYDPFANVTIEALAMGLYVISSKNNGGSEVLTPQRGLIIDNIRDKEGFAFTLEEGLKKMKDKENASKIRNSVKDFDFSLKLEEILQLSAKVTL